ncbi:MAG: O-antigen ligase family protein [Anaerolineae bacterium]|nr:O-antigen ligase family protein [Anaerolineae bacterium]
MIIRRNFLHSFKVNTGLGLSLRVLVGYVMVATISLALAKVAPLAALLVAGGGSILLGWEICRGFESLAPRHYGIGLSSHAVMRWHWMTVAVLCVNYAWFFVKDEPPAIGILLLIGILACRWWFTGHLFPLTPLNIPVAVLLSVSLLSGTVFSMNPAATYPKVYGLMFGVLFFCEVVYGLQYSNNLIFWIVGLEFVGLGVIGLGLLGADSFPNELFDSSVLLRYVPRLPLNLPRSAGGFHPNGLAGVIIYLIPIYVVVLTGNFFRGLKYGRVLVGLTVITLSSSVCLLLLSQSRGALSATFITGITLFLALKEKYRLSLAFITLSLLALVTLYFFGFYTTLAKFLAAEQSTAVNLASYTVRQSFWQLGLEIWQTFPLTGIGIGAFDFVVYNYFFDQYPDWILQDAGGWFPHVHNELLQIAIDLGVLGFTAFIAILAGVVRTAWHTFSLTADTSTRHLILGLAAGLLAHQIFGFTDVVYLGSKPGVVFWVMMGLVAALYRRELSNPLSDKD